MGVAQSIKLEKKEKPEKAPVQSSRVCKLGDSRHYIPQGKPQCYCGTEKRKKMPV